MLYRKTGFPEENELVICTVTDVHYNSVFAKLDEYEKTGMIHISEVSPGRIRNIRDYVKEGKKIICRVLKVNQERGHIDLSLRRVTEMQRREKTNWLKQEQKSEKIVEQIGKKLGVGFEEMYNEVKKCAFNKYNSLNACFEDVVIGNASLKDLGISAKLAKELEEAIKLRIKPPEVSIRGYFKLKSYDSNGADIIRKSLKKATETNKAIDIRYLGAGKYSVDVAAPDYKAAEKILEGATKSALGFIKEKGGEGEFVRLEK